MQARTNVITVVGDDAGFLLLVQLGRPWFTTGGVATASPLRVTVKGAVAGIHQVPGLPYEVQVV
jgi:hypothetical protein